MKSAFTRRGCILLAALAAALLIVPATAATMLVYDDFNQYAAGAKPDGYSIEETGGSVTVAEVPSAADKSLYLDDPGTNSIKIEKEFPPQSGTITVDISFMQPSPSTTAKVLRLLDRDGTKAAVHIETRKEGVTNVISYKNMDGSFTTLTAQFGKAWYCLRVVADVASQKADVYVNGELKLAGQAFMTPVQEIAALDSFTPGTSAKGHYLDNIRVYAGEPDPGTAPVPAVAAAPAGPVAVPGSELVRDLQVYETDGAGFWSVQPYIEPGAQLFGDRAYTVVSMPRDLAGYEYIRTSCDAKKHTGDPLATFVVGKDAEVYVAHDDRVAGKPSWLAAWLDTGEDVVDDEANPVTYSLFVRFFPAGSRVVLGNNGGSTGCTQYFVIVKGPDGPYQASSARPARSDPPVVWDAALSQKPAWYAGAEAVRIAENVLLYQRTIGGWPKGIDMAAKLSEADRATLAGLRGNSADCTIDNNATTAQIRYLVKVYAATGEERFKEGALRGLDYLLAAQYGNGGWPQYYPNTEGYYARITFNDNAMVNVLNLLCEAGAGRGDFAFVDRARRDRALKAVAAGIRCILRCQVRVNGRLTAWCAQHDEKTLAPAQARAYELPSLSGQESVGLTRFLMSIDMPGPELIEAVEAAVAWFERVKITGLRVVDKHDPALPGGIDKVTIADETAPPIWARFYEIGTDRPFFCGRDGIKKYDLAEIEHERRVGYAWFTSAPAYLLAHDYPLWRSKFPPK